MEEDIRAPRESALSTGQKNGQCLLPALAFNALLGSLFLDCWQLDGVVAAHFKHRSFGHFPIGGRCL